GAALSLWQFAQHRTPGHARLRIVNPRLEVEGWRAAATVVEIVNDDMPFLVDSVTAALHGEGLTVHLVIHPILHLDRDSGGALTALHEPGARAGSRESVMHVEVSSVTDPARVKALEARLASVLADVRAAVSDWRAMGETCARLPAEFAAQAPPVPREERDEAMDFLAWLLDDNFTFLGYREYRYGSTNGAEPDIVPGSGLGILRADAVPLFDGLRNFATLAPEVRAFLLAPRILTISKTNRRATVHRPVRMDAVAVRKFTADGKAAGERLFVGLFTSAAYAKSPRAIPVLRRKVSRTIARAHFEPASHDGKALAHILESLPRDELFQISEDELLDMSLGILGLQERQRTALFARRDPYGRFVSAFVYTPRDRYNTELRQRFAAVLDRAFQGEIDGFSTQLDESVLARVHFILRTTGPPGALDLAALERELAETARNWTDRLQDALFAVLGEERGQALFARYGAAFPAGYRERFVPAAAVHDIERIEAVRGGAAIALTLHRPLEAEPHELRFKIYRRAAPVALSDILPMLEHMGLKAIAEVPYEVRPADGGESLWMQDFSLLSPLGETDIASLKPRFEEAFARLWDGAMESDGFNRLILLAGLGWRQVVVLRLYAKVMRQAGSAYSQAYMEDALAAHPEIAARLVRLFERRFDPARAGTEEAETALGAE
ncbi:MAG: NAD-glutamate dehydrogenase, partial [Stellaceae bacterium]